MKTAIHRAPIESPAEVVFSTTVGESTTIDNTTASAICIFSPSGSPASLIAWYGSVEEDGPFHPVFLSTNVAATTNLNGGRVSVAPPEIFSVHYLRGVASVVTTGIVMKKG